MLSQRELDNLPNEVVKIIQQMEDAILQDVAKRIVETGELTPSAIRKLKSRRTTTLLQRDVIKTLAKYSKTTKQKIKEVFMNAGQMSLANDNSVLDKSLQTRRNKKINDIITKVERQTEGTWKNLTRTTASNQKRLFVKEMDNALLNVMSGAMTPEQAIKNACKNLADHMDLVTYPSGHKETLEVAVRRCILTGLNQMSAQLTLQNMFDKGMEYVEVSAHAGARQRTKYTKFDYEVHADWQGHIYHIKFDSNGKVLIGNRRRVGVAVYPDFVRTTGYGQGGGLCGWNCRHSFYPYVFGQKRRVTQKEVDEMNRASIEYKGKKYTQYEIDQKQRYIERQIRKYKRRAKLEKDSGLDNSKSVSFVKKWQKKLREFIKETENKRDYTREFVKGALITRGRPLTTKSIIDKKNGYINITDFWKGNITEPKVRNANSVKSGGKRWFVDGKNTVNDHNEHELEIAELLANETKNDVSLLPRVNYPKEVRTADFLIKNRQYELASIFGNGKNTIYDAIKRKKGQSSNFVIEITEECTLSNDEIYEQLKRIFKTKRTEFVRCIVIIEKNKKINVYKKSK